ncbi:protein kinase [Streptomyces sp. NPDC058739]|uniref:protein kinase domain-containing protein n=1 Tax=Streptomyces sp. NPDC058739 TaxID=3346618 RepID=UPI0036A9DB38
MGRVWRAADDMLDRTVAVKEIRIDGRAPDDPEDARTRRERTLREARATARIDHLNVVRVYDVVDDGERLWIVMELVTGRSLERITAEDGPLHPGEAARIGLGLVAALRQVHERGVLHRDIKPGNVLIEAPGQRVVLTDFGIAAIQDAKALTMVGMLVGSPDYMAPERVSGRPQGPPSDLWSLGATLAAALSGRSPFSRGTTLATLHAVLYEEPEIPAAAGPLHPLLTALLAKDPQARPALDALEAALRPIAHPEPVPTVTLPRPAPRPTHPQPHPGPHRRPEPPPPPRPPGPGPWWHRRRTALAAAAGVAAVGAVVAAVLVTATSGSPRDDDGDRAGGGGGGPSPTVTATVEGTYRPPSLPPGARQEAGGYAWDPPEGWRRDVRTGAEVHYTSPDGAQELVAKSSLARGDLMETWRTSEENARQGRDYRKIRLEETTFRGGPAVVWEYTFTLEGVAWHARLLGFNVDGKSYQVNTWYQPGIEEQALATYEDVKKSFTVL